MIQFGKKLTALIVTVLICASTMMLSSVPAAQAVTDFDGGNAYANAAKLFAKDLGFYGTNNIWCSVDMRGNAAGAAWCGDFVGFVAKKLGVSSSVIPRSGSAAAWSKTTQTQFHSLIAQFQTGSGTYDYEAAGRYDPYYEVQVGDIVTFCWGGHKAFSHVGIVTRIDSSKHQFWYVSGNTGGSKDSERTVRVSGPYYYHKPYSGSSSSSLRVIGFFHPQWSKVSSCNSTAAVSVVTASTNNVTLNVGETAQPTLTILPDNAFCKTVVWTSSDTSVAKVGKYNGLITAVSDGTAVITARAIADNVTSLAGGASATVLVTVGDVVDNANYTIPYKVIYDAVLPLKAAPNASAANVVSTLPFGQTFMADADSMVFESGNEWIHAQLSNGMTGYVNISNHKYCISLEELSGSPTDEYEVVYAGSDGLFINKKYNVSNTQVAEMYQGMHFWVYPNTVIHAGSYDWAYCCCPESSAEGWVAISSTSLCVPVENDSPGEFYPFQAVMRVCADEADLFTEPTSSSSSEHVYTYMQGDTLTVIGYYIESTGFKLKWCVTDDNYYILSDYLEIETCLEHVPGIWETIQEATQTSDGLRELHCTVCGELLQSETIPKTGSSTGPTLVSESTDAVTGHIYRLYKNNVTWEYAKAFAASLGTGWTLACMDGDSDNEQSIIENMVVNFDKACWLGGHNLTGSWMWLSGVPISTTDSRWASGEPSGNYQTATENYLGIYGNSTQTTWAAARKWNDFQLTSTTPKGFVVEYSPDYTEAMYDSPIDEYVVTYSGKLRVRKAPNTSSDVVTTIANGTHFYVWRNTAVAMSDYTWGYMYLPGESRVTGWIALDNPGCCEIIRNQPFGDMIDLYSQDTDDYDQLITGMVLEATCMDQNCGFVTWETSNASILRIEPYGDDHDFCLIEAVGSGTATITVGDKYVKSFEVIVDAAPTEGTCGVNTSWTLDNGRLTIAGDGPMDDFETSDQQPWYTLRESVQQVIIEEGITSIGDQGFTEMPSVQTISIPSTVSSIAETAFTNCPQLTNISVNTGNLSYVAQNGVLFNRNKSVLMVYPAGLSAATYTIPQSVTTLDYNAFAYSKLTSITVPDSVTAIMSFAFAQSRSLKTVILPSNLTTISGLLFYQCDQLETVSISNQVSDIGIWAFEGCSSLQKIIYRGTKAQWNNINISADAGLNNISIQYEPIIGIRLPDGVTTIESEAFSRISNHSVIWIPANVTSIASDAFDGVQNLTICGIEGSFAQTFAETYGYEFIAMSTH